MSFALMAAARRDLYAYAFHLAADDQRVAKSEMARVFQALEKLSRLPGEGQTVRIKGHARPLQRGYVHPFRVYYERQDGVLVVHRLYHHARRPIER
jgi:plasmid stabilization system protein ParE